MCICRVSLTHVHVCICDFWVDPKFKIFYRPSPQAETTVVCINMAPSMLTDHKKRRTKKLATILCPVIIMLVKSRFIFVCNNPSLHASLPPSVAPPALFRKTTNTHVGLFPKFGSQNRFFDNHEYSRRSLKLLLFLDSGVWRNLLSASFLSGRWQRRGINVTGSLNHWPCIFDYCFVA